MPPKNNVKVWVLKSIVAYIGCMKPIRKKKHKLSIWIRIYVIQNRTDHCTLKEETWAVPLMHHMIWVIINLDIQIAPIMPGAHRCHTLYYNRRILVSQILSFFKFLIIQTKPNIPSPIKHHNFTPGFLDLLIIKTNLFFSRWFETSWFHYIIMLP